MFGYELLAREQREETSVGESDVLERKGRRRIEGSRCHDIE